MYFKKVFVVILPLALAACSTSPATVKKTSFVAIIEAQMRCLDSLDTCVDGYEKLDSVNQHIRTLIDEHRNEVFAVGDTLLLGAAITASADKKLSLVSWNTRTGGTMLALAAMAVYKTDEKNARTHFIVDSLAPEGELSMISYQKLYTIQRAGGNIYVALGYGRGSSILPWQQLKAFAIKGNQLINPPVFPGKESVCFIEFDRSHLEGDVPDIHVDSNGRVIRVPVPGDREGFDSVYRQLVFRDSVYLFLH